MKCPVCGAGIDNDSVFCIECGARLDSQMAQDTNVSNTTNEQSYEPSGQSNASEPLNDHNNGDTPAERVIDYKAESPDYHQLPFFDSKDDNSKSNDYAGEPAPIIEPASSQSKSKKKTLAILFAALGVAVIALLIIIISSSAHKTTPTQSATSTKRPDIISTQAPSATPKPTARQMVNPTAAPTPTPKPMATPTPTPTATPKPTPAPVITSIKIRTLPNKIEYYKMDRLTTTGLSISCYYSNGTTTTVTSGFACSPMILENAGTHIITVEYAEKTTEFSVNVDYRIAIYTAEDLSKVHRDQDYILMNDIDLSSWGLWTPLCGANSIYYTNVYGYNGVFNGNGHIISNMRVRQVGSGHHAYGGLFAQLNNATIKNLTIQNGNIYAESSFAGYSYSRAYAGAICGEAAYSNIANCKNKNTSITTIASDCSCAGGIVGATEGKFTFSYCTNNGQVFGAGIHGITRDIYVGGILGYDYAGGYSEPPSEFLNCSNTGSISFDDSEMEEGRTAYKGNICGYGLEHNGPID